LIEDRVGLVMITADDIRRSGATSIPEALRLAPGVQMARVSAGRAPRMQSC
jgi:iron complex outermembrane receptor protein